MLDQILIRHAPLQRPLERIGLSLDDVRRLTAAKPVQPKPVRVKRLPKPKVQMSDKIKAKRLANLRYIPKHKQIIQGTK